MHIHFLGICGTFMGSLALLARQLGHRITGSDTAIYPPMSTQLQQAKIDIWEGYLSQHLQPTPDLVVVGNVCKRGMPAVEYMLAHRLRYTSAPQFLSDYILQDRHVLAVAGTHGKTTTTTMLAWILQYVGIDTGFLIGGVPIVNQQDTRLNSIFCQSAHLGQDYFVVEADEYDSAFFDKRSKFVHYRPTTAILNNLEYDHADIFADLHAIQIQFHHLIRTIAANGQIIIPQGVDALEQTLDMGVWTPVWRLGIGDNTQDTPHAPNWQIRLEQVDGSVFSIKHGNHSHRISWTLSGIHNVNNALMAMAAAYHVGVPIDQAAQALSQFAGIKRRMELIATVNGVQIYDDFAHHPTAIATTLDGATKKLAGRRIWAVIEPRSNTMKLGIYKSILAQSASLAHQVIWYEPTQLAWGLKEAIGDTPNQSVHTDIEQILQTLKAQVQTNDVIIIMSNGGFDNIHTRLLHDLSQ